MNKNTYTFDFEIKKAGNNPAYRKVTVESNTKREGLKQARVIINEYRDEQWPGWNVRLNYAWDKNEYVAEKINKAY